MQFHPCIRSSKLPIGFSLLGVTALGPRLDLGDGRVFFGYSLGKALPAEMAELNLCHVQPASMLGCIMDVELVGYSFGLHGLERLI